MWRDYHGVTVAITRHLKALGLQGIAKPLHSFRARFATMLINQGRDISTVQALLGHRNIQTTQGYIASTGPAKRATTDTAAMTQPHLYAAFVLSLIRFPPFSSLAFVVFICNARNGMDSRRCRRRVPLAQRKCKRQKRPRRVLGRQALEGRFANARRCNFLASSHNPCLRATAN